MSTKDHLESQFKRAGIPIQVTERAFVRNLQGGARITQIDVGINGNDEWIRCFPGDDSQITVMNVDKGHQQVVLSVREPERTFKEKQSLPWGERDPETGKRYTWVERTTPANERRLLVGMDERHLFISQMEEGKSPTTVKEAHNSLAPVGIPGTKKRRKKQNIKRQGEWFMVPATQEEIQEINQAIKDGKLEKKVALGSGGDGRLPGRGKPHVAKERVRLGVTGTVTRSRWSWQQNTQWAASYVRGWVRHADHKTIKLQDWHRVESNNEDRSSTATWYD